MRALSIYDISPELTHATIRARVDNWKGMLDLLYQNNFRVEEVAINKEEMSFVFNVLLPNNYVFHYLALREAVDKQEA